MSEAFVHQNINLFKSLKSLTLGDNVVMNEQTLFKILKATKQLKELRIFNDCYVNERVLTAISNYRVEKFHFSLQELRLLHREWPGVDCNKEVRMLEVC